jgi:hypothetical protein
MKKNLLIFVMALCTIIAEAQSWNSSTNYSSINNPNGTWRYGRKWSPQSTTFDIFTANWGANGWYFGGTTWEPSLQSGPNLWANDNSNGLPDVRWTSPYNGSFNLNATFIGSDSRGVNVIVYVALNDSLIYTGFIHNYLDSSQFILNNIQINQNDYLDFLVQWNGVTDHDYNWTIITAVIDAANGIGETNPIEAINLFPNPFSDEISVSLKNNLPSQIIIYDFSSCKLIEQNFITSTSLKTSQLAKGIYIYQIRSKDSLLKIGKLIKD